MANCFCSFLINFFRFVMLCRLRTCGWCIILARVHWRMASNSQYTLPPAFPTKKASGNSQLRSKQLKLKEPSTENFMAIAGFFEHYTYRVMALGWLKKEDRKKERRWTIQTFDSFLPNEKSICLFICLSSICLSTFWEDWQTDRSQSAVAENGGKSCDVYCALGIEQHVCT